MSSKRPKFFPKTERIVKIYKSQEKSVDELIRLFGGNVGVYIDYANVRPWSEKLGWHVDPKRLKQFLDSFSQIKQKCFYQGTLAGDSRSEEEIKLLEGMNYTLRTKPVKIMKISIDATSVSSDSTALLKNFIRRALLRKYDIETIEFLNGKFYEMNKKDVYYIEDRKCNFDVEIGTDMLVEAGTDGTQTFCLWSGDSDFADPIKQLLSSGKKVILFATARKVSKELNTLKDEGLIIFEISKIKDYICWKKELSGKQKGLSSTAPKL